MDLGGGGGGTVLVVWEQTLPYLEPKLRTWGYESLPNRDLCQETRRKRKTPANFQGWDSSCLRAAP